MDDLISRQAAIEYLRNTEYIVRESGYPGTIKKEIVGELVRCQNCKWWDNEEPQPFGYCHAAKHCHYSRHWEIQIYRTTEPDFFCKDGERRDDGKND